MTTLSVITLTRNRLGKVQLLLDRLLPQLAPGDEVVLVDTGSTDGTREHFSQYHHESIHFMIYDGAGSWAEMRNFGVGQARGALIAFLDDDCLPAPDWVARGKAALIGVHDGDGADAVGGVVRPHGIERFPRWWHPEMGWMVGLSVPGHIGPAAGTVHYPCTANLWVRADVCRREPFQEVGGWLGEPENGRAGADRYLTGREDAQWWRRLRVTGYRVRFDAGLVVNHAFDPARLKLDYLRRRAELDGAAWAAREGTRDDLAPLILDWWRRLFFGLGAPWIETAERLPDRHFHRLMRRRQGAAIAGLLTKYYSGFQYRLARRLGWWHGCGLVASTVKVGRRLVRRSLDGWLQSQPQRRRAARVERLAIVAFGCLGDLVILQSALRGLMQAHPGVEIYVLTTPAGRLALGGVPRLNLTVPPADLKPGSRPAVRWLDEWLTRLDPDAIIAPYLHPPWGPVVTRLRRPYRPIVGWDGDNGHDTPALRRYLERITVRVHKSLDHHESLNLCALLREVGLPCNPVPARITPQPENLDRARQHSWFGGRLETAVPVVMLNPDAGHVQKEWTDEAWVELIGYIISRTAGAVVVNASRPRRELEVAVAAAVPEARERIFWLREAPLDDLVAWLSLCRALVTVDAGPEHLAHALDVPSLTLFGPMDERRWADYWHRPVHRTIRACAYDLTPEERRGLPVNSMVACIRAEDVYTALVGLMAD